MSGPFENQFNYAPPDQLIQQYGIYDNSYGGPPTSVNGPSVPFEGVGFWYRPERTETVFDPNPTVFNQNMTTSATFIEPAVAMKHRRTRSGCFTCRQRRVKCDERRPVCERCRKGNRQCDYPQTSSLTKRGSKDDSTDAHSQSQPQKSSKNPGQILAPIEDDSEDDDEEELTAPRRALGRSSPSKGGTGSTQLAAQKQKHRQQREASTTSQEFGTIDEHSSQGQPQDSGYAVQKQPYSSKWSHLKPQMQEFLQFQQEHMTYHHYLFSVDQVDFLHNEFIDIALSFEPLLYAVTGFAAYHHAIRRKDGKFEDFWKYYCRSIVLLRKQLELKTEQNEAVLLTILQLATFEEFLGDWVNLSSHHKAAHSILSSLYNFDNFLKDETSRHIFDWFARVDIMASLIAGAEVMLEREWFAIARSWHETRYRQDNTKFSHALSYFHANLRLISLDMARTFANAMESSNFREEVAELSQRLDAMRIDVQNLHDTNYTVTEYERDSSEEREGSPDVFDSRVPLFRDHLWPLNFVWISWYGSQQMLLYKTTLFSRAQAAAQTTIQGSVPSPSSHMSTQELPPGLEKLSLIQCQIYEAVEQWSEAPAGANLGCHISMALAAVFLRREPKYTMWARQKLANAEITGYIWPPTLRKKMAQLWGVEEVEDWWLPNGEGKFPLLDEIRGVVDERTRESIERGRDDGKSDLRDIKAIFDKLDIGSPTNTEGFSTSEAGSSHFGSPSEVDSNEGVTPGFSPSSQTGRLRARGGSVGNIPSTGRQARSTAGDKKPGVRRTPGKS